jgi:CubicO group peptidase (beta-lactamase class C family)
MTRKPRFALAVLALIGLACAKTRAEEPSVAAIPQLVRLRTVERALDQRRQELHIPGMSLVIVKDDRIIFLKGFGQRDVERDLPVTPDTLFAIGSSTKAFTTLGVMMSVDEKKLALTDSPKKYLPYFKLQDPEADSKITLTDLLCHRSGLDRTDLIWYPGVLKSEDVIRALADVKPTAKLGEKFQYQNVMFLAAGMIAGKVHRQSWSDFTEERILRPLGMERTNLTVREMESEADHSLGYDWDEAAKKAIHRPMRAPDSVPPAGAINSSAREMAQWLRFMLAGGEIDGKRLVSPESFRELGEERIELSPTVGYGFGWFLRSWYGHKVMEHAGNIDGFNAQVALMPDQHLGFVLLTNVSASPLVTAAQATIWENLVGHPQTSAETAASAGTEAPAADPKPEVGRYALNSGLALEIRLKDGKLTVQADGQREFSLENRGGRRYRIMPPGPENTFISFRPNGADAARTELVLEQSGQASVGPRVVTATAPPAAPPIGSEELMRRVVEALGGEANLRRHHSLIQRYEYTLDQQGIRGHTEHYAQVPNRYGEVNTWIARGKTIATTREWYDGKAGGETASFSGSTNRIGAALADAAAAADFNPELNWKTVYKAFQVKDIAKVGDENAYRVVKAPENGTPVTEYYSTRTFHLLRREIPAGPGQLLRETYKDYRPVDGVLMPYEIFREAPGSGPSTVRLKEARWDQSIPEKRFKGK